MKKSNKGVRVLTTAAISVSCAMILSYIEFLLPPIFSAVPGIKVGLANIVIIFLLYRASPALAITVSLVRVSLSSLLFGSILVFAYSFAGAILSFLVMLVAKKIDIFSEVGVSILGAVFHNLGQIAVAVILLGTKEIAYYMIPLTVSGILAGIFVGIVSALCIKRIRKINF